MESEEEKLDYNEFLKRLEISDDKMGEIMFALYTMEIQDEFEEGDKSSG